MKHLLITGVHSYIGNAVEAYLEQWNKREGQGRYQVDKISLRDGFPKPDGESKWDALLHVAGIAHADISGVSEETKALYYRVNRDLTVDTAKWARQAGIPLFIYLSSVIVYGESGKACRNVHITADRKPAPTSFYGDSKYQGELGLQELETEDFHVAILRLPMVYGKGSKGNFPMLVKLAERLPFFPNIENKRSMIYVENLAEFIRLLTESGGGGIFFPQNEEYVSTAELVKEIGTARGKKIRLTRALNPFVRLACVLPGKVGGMAGKAFGSLTIDRGLDQGPEGYRKYSFLESIRKSV